MSNYLVKFGDATREVVLESIQGTTVQFRLEDKSYVVNVEPVLQAQPTPHHAATPTTTKPPSQLKRQSAAINGAIVAPMPGLVLALLVKVGEQVKAGQAVLVVEAMKMENRISAPISGTVKEVSVTIGQEVQGGQTLLVIE